MEYSKILKRLLVTPNLISKKFSYFKKQALSDLFELVEHLESQYIELDIRQAKMKKINRLIQDLNKYSFSSDEIRNNIYFHSVYLEWLKFCFQNRLMENGFTNLKSFLEKTEIKLDLDEHMDLLLNHFAPISCKEEATSVEVIQLNPIRPALPGISGNLRGMSIRYNKYSIFGLITADPLRLHRSNFYNQEKLKELPLLKSFSLRDLLIREMPRLEVLIRRDKQKKKHYLTQSVESMTTEFKFMPIAMKYRMIILLLENKQEKVCQILLSQIPELEGEALISNLDWVYRVQLGKLIANKATTDNSINKEVPYEMKISCMAAPEKVKSKAYDMLKIIRKSNDGAPKAQKFLDALLKIPFGQIRQEPDLKDPNQAILNKIKLEFPDVLTESNNLTHILDNLEEEVSLKYKTELSESKEKQQNYLNQVQDTLEKAVHGHQEAKIQVRRLLAQWICGGQSGMVIGLQGPPGNGKTTLIKQGLAQCLVDPSGKPRPVGFIPLGGSTSGSALEGHSYTYQGSKWGKIAEVLMNSSCMNPILLFDELDKVSKTERGREIIGILTHLTDSTQNQEFSDRYFDGIPLDLSRAVMVFTFNDISAIDPILLDRLTVIKTKPLSLPDKIVISRKHLLTEIALSIGLQAEDIDITDELIKYIIQTYTAEAGARQLKQLLRDLARELNLRRLTDPSVEMKITNKLIDDVFKNKDKTRAHKIPEDDLIGQINGMYANVLGMGGVLPIQVSKTRSENCLSMELTGMQGDVMKESMKCAKTMAWSLLEKEIQDDINEKDKFGLHIHCPNAATPKDGPSAGGAICLAILSSLSNKAIKKDVAMTGEIDLRGKITAIGGLGAKLTGAKEAGVKLALIPKQNHPQLERLRQQNLSPEDEHFIVQEIDHISEAIQLVFSNN